MQSESYIPARVHIPVALFFVLEIWLWDFWKSIWNVQYRGKVEMTLDDELQNPWEIGGVQKLAIMWCKKVAFIQKPQTKETVSAKSLPWIEVFLTARDQMLYYVFPVFQVEGLHPKLIECNLFYFIGACGIRIIVLCFTADKLKFTLH